MIEEDDFDKRLGTTLIQTEFEEGAPDAQKFGACTLKDGVPRLCVAHECGECRHLNEYLSQFPKSRLMWVCGFCTVHFHKGEGGALWLGYYSSGRCDLCGEDDRILLQPVVVEMDTWKRAIARERSS